MDEDLGAEVFLYEPGKNPPDGEFTDLTAGIRAGFGDPLNKYAWSAELFDGSDPDDNPELYVGTFSTQNDIIGQLSLGVLGPTLLATGALDLSVIAGGFGTTEPNEAILGFLATDLPNYRTPTVARSGATTSMAGTGPRSTGLSSPTAPSTIRTSAFGTSCPSTASCLLPRPPI